MDELVTNDNTKIIFGARYNKFLQDLKSNSISKYSIVGTFTNDQAKIMFGALKDNISLVSLNIICSDIGDACAKYIAEVLRHNSTLKRLNIRYNNIGDDGAKYIAEVLYSKNTECSLTYLAISDNNIGDVGLKYFMEALKYNSTLTYIDVSNNNISEEGFKCISECFMYNSTLVGLCIDFFGTFRRQFNKFIERNEKNKEKREITLFSSLYEMVFDKHD